MYKRLFINFHPLSTLRHNEIFTLTLKSFKKFKTQIIFIKVFIFVLIPGNKICKGKEQCYTIGLLQQVSSYAHIGESRVGNSYFYIEKWTFKGMCEVYYRAKRDKKEATCL